jgi:hypothetical protein
MSGGSLDYVYDRVHDAAQAVRRRAETPLHRALANHLDKVSDALHDLEWVLSGDKSEGDEIPAIEACLSREFILEHATQEAREALANLEAALEKATAETAGNQGKRKGPP